MSRISISWRLVQSSWAVLRSDKELIIFPIISGIATLIVFALFAVPLWVSGYFERLEDDASGQRVTGFVVLFAMYVVLRSVAPFTKSRAAFHSILNQWYRPNRTAPRSFGSAG